jgi:hypothetical protein
MRKLFLVGSFLAAAASALAQEAATSNAHYLLVLMRVDDQFSAQLSAALKIRCAATPEGQREACRAGSGELLRQIAEQKPLAQLMASFFERHYTTEEIKALTDFFGSSDGKVMTESIVLASYYRILGDLPKSPKPIDAATQRRLNAFLQSGVGKKFSDLLPQYKLELDRQSAAYLCTILEKRGSSCAGLGIGDAGTK